ncbi:MAG: 1-deoxy-D-xylulose-5-phosphate reductoisomerase [Planctomycetia bacterium]
MKRIMLLGATGSIGTQTLDVVRADRAALSVVGLSAHRRWSEVFDQAAEFQPRFVVLTDESLKGAVDRRSLHPETELLWGEAGVEKAVSDPCVDVVVAAMVGAAGLRGALAALDAGKPLALANKETLVVGGPIVTELAKRRGVDLLPIDSEHSAVAQCLRAGNPGEVARIILTASGGPFRTTPLDQFPDITIEQALKHPTWTMGPKITIDSATMMNKALEIIEAHWLFDVPADKIAVMIHPQSIAHSMVEFVDGSVTVQASPPDMRLPIQYALTYPRRRPSPTRKFDWSAAATWEFIPPDPERYPALELGYEVVRRRGTSGAALNAANETAVARFLNGEIRFPDIVALCRDVLNHHPYDPGPTLEEILRIDRWARKEAASWNCCRSSR